MVTSAGVYKVWEKRIERISDGGTDSKKRFGTIPHPFPKKEGGELSEVGVN